VIPIFWLPLARIEEDIMSTTLLLQFWGLAVLLAMTPGADWAYAITAGVRARRVAPAVLGMLTGYVLLITVVAVGAGALVAANPAVLTALTVAGALYLLYLGVTTMLASPDPLRAAESGALGNGRAEYLKGVAVSGLNPKGMLLLLALLPQFVTAAGAWSLQAQMFTLGGIHVLNCAVVYTIVALAARRLLRGRPGAGALVTKVAGAAMTLVGLVLIAENVVPHLVG
jgi:threonine/homoserine/homoserine lactone efflux protein